MEKAHQRLSQFQDIQNSTISQNGIDRQRIHNLETTVLSMQRSIEAIKTNEECRPRSTANLDWQRNVEAELRSLQERVQSLADPSMNRETIPKVVNHVQTLQQEVNRLIAQLSMGAQTHEKTLRGAPCQCLDEVRPQMHNSSVIGATWTGDWPSFS